MGLGDAIGASMPEIGITKTGIGTTMSIVGIAIFFIIVAIVVGIIVYFRLRKKKFNKEIVIFERVGGSFEPARKDFAMEMKVGEGGDTLFRLYKHKKFLPLPKIQVGRNIYWYFVREDGEWINFGIEDLDAANRELKAHFADVDMRYARAALQKNLRDRYNKMTFMQKYGGMLVWTALILVLCVGTFLIMGKFLELSGSLQTVVDAAAEVQIESQRLLATMENLKYGTGFGPGG